MPNTTNRITVVEHVYHQVAGHDPTAIDSVFTREVTETEQVYTRKSPKGLSTEWEPLDTGWVKDPSMIFICNDAKEGTIEIMFLGGAVMDRLLVLPSETQRLTVPDATRLRIRRQEGIGQYTLTAIPR
ncbi:MAG: hypothetical protein WC455_11315 [Dehalococcoidia bacterium]|jgi:hypothetical protein